MKHTYKISGMTCTGCQSKVQSLLSKVPGVQQVNINLEKEEAAVTMSNHISTDILKTALKDHPKYQLSETEDHHMMMEESIESKTWLQTYKPILLIFAYIAGITAIAGFSENGFDWMRSMRIFMAGFFLSFSFFKMLDLDGFSDSYSTYDIVAKQFRGWGHIYAFIELGLGIAYALNFNPLVTNILTFTVMIVSIIGVLKSVLNKRKIRCACLGAVFNLPMSTVTIIEDALMIIMSGIMLILVA